MAHASELVSISPDYPATLNEIFPASESLLLLKRGLLFLLQSATQ